MVTTGAPKVMLGTKWPSIMSTCSQSAPCEMVSLHAFPRAPKSADRIEGAMIAGGGIVGAGRGELDLEGYVLCRPGWGKRCTISSIVFRVKKLCRIAIVVDST